MPVVGRLVPLPVGVVEFDDGMVTNIRVVLKIVLVDVDSVSLLPASLLVVVLNDLVTWAEAQIDQAARSNARHDEDRGISICATSTSNQ